MSRDHAVRIAKDEFLQWKRALAESVESTVSDEEDGWENFRARVRKDGTTAVEPLVELRRR